MEIDHEIFSTVILSLPLIQEGQLAVSDEKKKHPKKTKISLVSLLFLHKTYAVGTYLKCLT